MTDWIDERARILSPEEQQRNREAARQRLQADIIDEHGLAFVQTFTQAVAALVNELNEKIGASLGGVTLTTRDDGLMVVNNGGRRGVSIEIAVNLTARAIGVTLQRRGPEIAAGDAEILTFTLEVDDQTRLHADGMRRVFYDPTELASFVFQLSFTPDLLAS